MTAGTHAAVLHDVPVETDVMHVLTRRPQVPQYVITENWAYRIDIDGTITLLGTRAAVFGQ